ncbi:MAG TPA: lysophospholipid acyltransferase family protein [Burkholderiaceae bacterium]|nr:lysophospholipid acyltransferase family protein [Burkholderiaceae bacterium]
MLVRLSRLAARLPLAWSQALGALAGRAALALSPSFRRKSSENLALAGLLDEPMLRRTAAEVGRAAAETPFVWFGEHERVEALIRVEGQDVLDAARAAGRGVILLTPHLGCFEAAARAVARSGPITVLYKPPRIDAMRRLVETGRASPGVRPVPASASGVRGLLRALKRGEAIGVLPDQVPSDGDGAWVPFFGRPAYTMTLPHRLARLTGASVLLACGERLPRGAGWRVRFEPLAGEPTPEAVNRAMETLIRRLPEQYFWGYNRYKAPARAGEPRTATAAGDEGTGGGA